MSLHSSKLIVYALGGSPTFMLRCALTGASVCFARPGPDTTSAAPPCVVTYAHRMANPQDWDVFLAATDEFTAVKALLDHGVEQAERIRFIQDDGHVVAAVLASGVEKLLKLTYGYALTHRDGSWPGHDIRRFGHRILDLHQACLEVTEPMLPSATNPGVLDEAHRDMQRDPLVVPLLGLLANYGAGGRFYNLDTLAAATQVYESPGLQWRDIDDTVAELLLVADPDLLSDDDRFKHRRGQVLATAVRRWRVFYVQLWVQNVIGGDAHRFGLELGGHRL